MTEAERKRKGIAITVITEVSSEQTACYSSAMDSFHLETAADIPIASGCEALLPNDGLPRLTHVDNFKSTALNQQPKCNSYARQPSQTGSTAVVTYCNKDFVWALATMSCEKEVVFRTLDVPSVENVNVEFYSGALFFLTKDRKSVVIQYFA
ncbi:hypothetical protein DFH11DRAFT_1582312 [Phellopilus nigrolimitatus]|nr:hypothetical protein DFH11DRAFT_1582312 [Phellopilus nigrolimitatus]